MLDEILLLIAVGSGFASIIFFAYCFRVLYVNRAKTYFRKRGINLLIINICFVATFVCFVIPFSLLHARYGIVSSIYFLVRFGLISLFFGITDIIVCRVYYFVSQINKMATLSEQMKTEFSISAASTTQATTPPPPLASYHNASPQTTPKAGSFTQHQQQQQQIAYRLRMRSMTNTVTGSENSTANNSGHNTDIDPDHDEHSEIEIVGDDNDASSHHMHQRLRAPSAMSSANNSSNNSDTENTGTNITITGYHTTTTMKNNNNNRGVYTDTRTRGGQVVVGSGSSRGRHDTHATDEEQGTNFGRFCWDWSSGCEFDCFDCCCCYCCFCCKTSDSGAYIRKKYLYDNSRLKKAYWSLWKLVIVLTSIWLFETGVYAVYILMIEFGVFEKSSTSSILFNTWSFINLCIKAIYIIHVSRTKISKFSDNWHIKQEFKIYGKIFVVFIISQLVGPIILDSEYRGGFLGVIGNIFFWTLTYYMVIWVQKVNRQSERDDKENSMTTSITDINDRYKRTGDHGKTGSEHLTNIEVLSQTDQNNAAESQRNGHSGKSGLTVTRLNRFWDILLDVESGHKNVKTEFKLFIKHSCQELALENLLFFVNCVQLIQFIVKHDYLSINDNNAVTSNVVKLSQFNGSHHIHNTVLISNLVGMARRTRIGININNNNNHNTNNNEININGNENIYKYEIFRTFFQQLYEKYVESGEAPFEINISYHLRLGFSQIIAELSDEEFIITKEFFESKMLSCIIQAAFVVHGYLRSSFHRFKKKYTPKDK